jgi:hypothetical protein
MPLFLSDQFKFVIEDWELSVVVLPAIDRRERILFLWMNTA